MTQVCQRCINWKRKSGAMGYCYFWMIRMYEDETCNAWRPRTIVL